MEDNSFKSSRLFENVPPQTQKTAAANQLFTSLLDHFRAPPIGGRPPPTRVKSSPPPSAARFFMGPVKSFCQWCQDLRRRRWNFSLTPVTAVFLRCQGHAWHPGAALNAMLKCAAQMHCKEARSPCNRDYLRLQAQPQKAKITLSNQ